jgi:cysteine desulfurase
MTSVYLDYNATAPIRPEALAAASEAMVLGGNPSSVHAAGRAARALIEAAREQVAALIGGPASTVVFTSGGTEANALAVESAVAAGSRRLLIGATEHDCVRATAEASAAIVETWPVDANGVADLDWLEARLQAWSPADGRPFAALMLANNETGVIQPVAQAAALMRAAEGWLHVDAVQAAGKIAVDSRALGADTLAIASHKLGGPTGAGALTFGPRASLSRRLHGGGQERGRRAGTENLAGIAGFGAAAAAALRNLPHLANQAGWRDAVAARLVQDAGVTVFGQDAPRVANTLCFAAPGYSAELQVMALDLEGVMVSAGSACSSGKVKPSQVLLAMGAGLMAGNAIRVSGGWASTQADWDRFADIWLAAHARHQARHRSSAA